MVGSQPLRIDMDIDDELIRDAMRITGITAESDVVEAGLRFLLQVSGQAEMRRFRGRLKWVGDLDEMRTIDEWNRCDGDGCNQTAGTFLLSSATLRTRAGFGSG